MTKRRFFPFVWRVNALLIFAVGIGCLLVLLFAAAMFIKDRGRTRHANDIIHVNGAQVEKAETKLGAFSAIGGSATLRAPLNLSQEFAAGMYSSKGTNAVQNYLFFDPVSHTSRWLIAGNRGLILDTTELPERNFAKKDEEPVESVVYTLVDTDSDGNGKLTDDDLKTIAVSDPDGKRFVRLFTKVERINGVHLAGKDALVVLYTSGKQLRAADVDLKSSKIVRESILKP